MMLPVIELVLGLLAQLAPQLASANAPLIAKIVNGLVVLVPIVIQQYKELAPIVQNVIRVLKDSGKLTEDQWNTLIELETRIDAEFDKAASDALAEDEAADKQQS